MTKSRKLAMFAGAVVVLLVAGIWGYTSLNGATTDVDASRVATVERGTMVKSVVATGKIEPITKVEIKSKANGIIEALHVDVDQVVGARATSSPSSTRSICGAASVSSRPTSRRRAPRSKPPSAQLAEEPRSRPSRRTSSSRSATYDRAQNLFDQHLLAQSALDDAKSALEVGPEPPARRAGAAGRSARPGSTEAARPWPQAQAAVERAEEELANATISAPIRATVLTARRRDRKPRVVDPEPRRERDARHDARRHRAGVRPRQGGRGRHRPRAARAAGAHHASRRSRTRSFEGRSPQISPIGVEKDNVTTFEVKVSIENRARSSRPT